ncbi:hypothetical protein [Halovenus salina]|uniref:Uncharacterized protein n=1 Tax=Halovenus salina TaxID=1510225 RepID=A0ABD5W0S7_9EURY|nr:hypothetical protein [Halovenus salina]
MSVSVHLDTAIDGNETLDCETAKLVGDVVLAESDDRTRVVPMGNVAGVDGDEVEKTIEAVEYEGGRVTELVTQVE